MSSSSPSGVEAAVDSLEALEDQMAILGLELPELTGLVVEHLCQTSKAVEHLHGVVAEHLHG